MTQSQSLHPHRVRAGSLLRAALAIAFAASLLGCEVDSFFDPSRTGRFERYPTMIPVLERLDVIEQEEDYWSKAAPPTPEDLIPSDLEYVLYPGDIVTVGIFELFEPGRWFTTTRQIDAGGYYRVPELGDVQAAGLTPQQFEDQLIARLREQVLVSPQVDVVVEQASGLRYTVYGFVQAPGMYGLRTPDLRLLDALAIAGGVPLTTERIFIIRTVPLTEEFRPSYEQPSGMPAPTAPQQPVDVEELIEQLEGGQQQRRQPAPQEPPAVSPGMLQDADEQDAPMVPPTQVEPNGQAPIDIDALEPVRVAPEPPVDVDVLRRPPVPDQDGDSFIYVPERGEWVRVRGQADRPSTAAPVAPEDERRQMVVERIIEINYQRLSRGDSSLNVVVRPNDLIYVEGPLQGLVYIDGEIVRPGVYQLPNVGRLTLSRFIATAGGLGPIAIPERVDLTRKVGPNREAKIRLDLAAIRQGTEPDIYMKPDDHIIIGTSWAATPIAIFRNGFRATYGFGFVLDRNFASDVFGPERVQSF